MTPKPLSDAEWNAFGVSRESRARIELFVELTLAWQARINLISPATVPAIWTRHVLDSLQILPLLPKHARAFADLGSGGGYPALPLAVVLGAKVHLYESNGKKAAFLREALRQTKTQGEVHNIRLEAIGTQPPTVDFVTARALAPLPLLLDLATPFLSRKVPCFFHKGQDVDAELTEALKSWRINARTHKSSTDSLGVILEIKEAFHV